MITNEQNIVLQVRKKLGLDQKAFAQLLRDKLPGVKTCAVDISRWENGYHYPGAQVVNFIASEAGITPGAVMDNLTRHLRPSKYTLEGKLKCMLGGNRQKNVILNKLVENNQLKMY